MCIPKPVVDWLLSVSRWTWSQWGCYTKSTPCDCFGCSQISAVAQKTDLQTLIVYSLYSLCLPLMKHGEVWCSMQTFTFKVVLHQMCCCCIQHISVGATFTLNVSIQISGLQHTISSFTTFWRGVCECWQTCDRSNMLATKVIAMMFLAHFIPSWAISYTLATICNLQQSLGPTGHGIQTFTHTYTQLPL